MIVLPDLTETSLPKFEKGVNKVDKDATRQWGTLTPHEMMAHLAFSFRMSLGIEELEDESNFFTRSKLFRNAIFLYMPWPKGKIKAPPGFTPEPAQSFEEDRADVLELMKEFTSEFKKNPKRTVKSPIMGDVPLSFWSIIHGRHTAWHLQQFGVDVKWKR